MSANAVDVNRAMYLSWLRQEYPDLYSMAVFPLISEAKARGLAGFLDSLVGGFKSVVSNVTQALPGLAKTYVDYDVQKRLIKANTDRAMQGLAPLQYNAMGQLVVSGGIPYSQADLQLAQQQLAAPLIASPSDNTLLYVIGGVGVLLVIVLSSRNSRR